MVTAVFQDGSRSVRRADPGGSYLATGDPRAFFAVTTGVRVSEFVVVWPDGAREAFPGTEADTVSLRRGAGESR